ncbi:MAG: Putative short-chain dehydrogenase [uncultured Thermomicrobiales bacterium]|uniref:Short-chain dehydrogenase n=1 Tax=uncultured Thermomicrobiales bacterium TaxID=1645740 RepID=A0A6J4U7W3_9BACT|nr:MAG: Putative short-chain dehydrogenase [uncultured Thermomicrobiales bacterium]
MTDGRVNGLRGAVAMVTGTGSGIGEETSYALAAAGARLVVTELPDRLDRAEATAAAIRERHAGEAVAIPLDVTDLDSVAACVEAASAAFGGRIDVLVNNAGLNVPQMAFDVTEEAWDRVLDVNLKGLFFMAQAIGRRMRDQRPAGGSIVNIASQMGIVGYTKRAAYCSSKAGAVNLSRVLAFEWAEHNIRVNAVCPTFVETPLTRPMFEDPEFKADVLRRIPLGRLATPADVADAVVYLAGPGAAMVTGHALLVDGGWTAV